MSEQATRLLRDPEPRPQGIEDPGAAERAGPGELQAAGPDAEFVQHHGEADLVGGGVVSSALAVKGHRQGDKRSVRLQQEVRGNQAVQLGKFGDRPLACLRQLSRDN